MKERVFHVEGECIDLINDAMVNINFSKYNTHNWVLWKWMYLIFQNEFTGQIIYQIKKSTSPTFILEQI